jgi:glycolate oxidase FAD binding subunit
MTNTPFSLRTDAATLAAHTVHGVSPRAVAFPADAAACAALMEHAAHQHWHVVPWGGGTRQLIGAPPRQVDVVINTTNMNRILQHEPDDLTISVEAGITAGELRRYLAQSGQMIPIDPALPERTTIGGMIATAADGPRRAQYGILRDMMIGISVVEPHGQASRAGGMVVKNVSGFDMMKLYHGSYGTLALITAANFKLIPIPPARASIVIGCASRATALAVIADIQASPLTPSICELLDATCGGTIGADAPWSVVMAAEGPTAAVERHLRDGAAIAQAHHCSASVARDVAHDDRIQRIADASATDPLTAGDLVLRVATIPSALAALLDRVDVSAAQIGGRPVVHARARSGCGTIRLTGLTVVQQNAWVAAFPEIIAVATLASELASYWQLPQGGYAVMQRIKAEFDPQHRMNPGRFVV